MWWRGEEEFWIAVSTEETVAAGGGGGGDCWDDDVELRLAGEPRDMVGKVDGGNIDIVY